MQNNYLNHKKIYKTKEKITRFEFTPNRIGGATVAGNGERGARYSPEQSHGAAVQRLSPSGGCGGPWRSGATEARRRARWRARRTRERGCNQRQRDGGAQEAATEERRWCDEGRNEGWTVARRWLPPFRLLFGGGARLATQTSWMEAQSAMERAMERVPDGGHGGGSLREREDDEQ